MVQRLSAELAAERSARAAAERKVEDLTLNMTPLERKVSVTQIEAESSRASAERAHAEALEVKGGDAAPV